MEDGEIRTGGHLVPEGAEVCLYCGATRELLSSAPETSCVATDKSRAPRQFHSSIEDYDAIREGVDRIRKEQDEALRRETQ